MTSNEINLTTFKVILDFINDLFEIFGQQQHSLALYHRLVSRTMVSDVAMISRHVQVFKSFCESNRVAICEKNGNKLSPSVIVFSDRIKINLYSILKKSDKETAETIWKYLLTLSVCVDANSPARDVLQQDAVSAVHNRQQSSDLSGISSVFTDMMSTMQEELEKADIQPSDNPMEMVAGLMKSGAIESIMKKFSGKMESGEINIGSIMGLAQGLMKDMGDNPMLTQMMSGIDLESMVPKQDA